MAGEQASRDDRFAEHLVRYQDRVYRFITMLVPRREDAEDLFQQTCLILWRKRDRFDAAQEFVPWACGIARNEVRNFLRKSRHPSVQMRERILAEIAETALAQRRSIDARLAALSDCLKKLPGHQRELLERCYKKSETIDSIAGSLALTPNALYLKLRRIRQIVFRCITHALALEV